MRTPDEIKKGLELCYIDKDSDCTGCPYHENMCTQLEKDAFEYIQQLEATIAEREKVGLDMAWKLGTLEAQVPKWISVEERLPKEVEDVLVFCRNGEITWANVACRVGTQWWRGGVHLHCVTHWMPLPEPPKEG